MIGRRAVSVAALCVGCGALSATILARQQPPIPSFRSSVDVTSIDVAVVDDRGQPIRDLHPDDFTVRVDGAPRRVVSAEWVAFETDSKAPAPAQPPDGYSTNEASTGGRLIILAVDEPNIRFGGAVAITRAAGQFVDRLLPSDRVAVAGIGTGAPSTAFTADRRRIKEAIARMVGQKQSVRALSFDHTVSLGEAMQIDRGDRSTLQTVQSRECQSVQGPAAAMCFDEVEVQARTVASDANHAADQTFVELRELFRALAGIEGPKTLILISEGFVLTDVALANELGALSAAARTSLYALRLDNQFFDAADSRVVRDPVGDRQTQGEGLEALAGVARGTLFNVTGTGAAIFDRIAAELSGYYLLGVESDPRDKDARPHAIRVDVPRRGAIVRSRRQLLNVAADAKAGRTGRQAVAAAMSSPLTISALPLRVASFALQGPERDKVQILIHADIGVDYSSSKIVSAAYVITDRNGRMVESRTFDARLLPVMNGVPSALQYRAGASLAPGDYTFKLAVAEGDRVGSVEHPIHASLDRAADLTFSELMVGGPIDVGELLQPTIGYQVTFGSLHGYFEAYGADSRTLAVEYEVATDATSPALIDVDVPPHPAGDARTIFTRVVPIRQLPPGKYVLRAVVSVNDRSIKTFTRGFEVMPPRVLMTSADSLGLTSVDAELFLPIDEAGLMAPFEREQAIETSTLQPFRERTPPSVKDDFERGVALLASGDYPQAETAFKRGIQPEIDSTASLAYLAVSFAASGHDIEAASAFQTALVDGSDIPQLYDWLAGALVRDHDFGEARSILEEAVSKWPSDMRFTKPLALLYATFGRGREAVRTLERYLDEKRDDRDALYLAVRWLYTVHMGGASVHGPAKDTELAKTYAAAYAKDHGPRMPLVQQWIAFLEGEKR